jgi:preprotein translocase subunit SecB
VDDSRQPGIQIDQVFLNRAFFEHGDQSYAADPGAKIPEMRFRIAYEVKGPPGDSSRAFATLRIESEPEPEFFYRIMVEIGAVVSTIRGQENLKLSEYVREPLITTLFPFAREAVAALTGRGRQGPLYLKPFNLKAALQSMSDELVPAKKTVAKAIARTRNHPARRRRD